MYGMCLSPSLYTKETKQRSDKHQAQSNATVFVRVMAAEISLSHQKGISSLKNYQALDNYNLDKMPVLFYLNID